VPFLLLSRDVFDTRFSRAAWCVVTFHTGQFASVQMLFASLLAAAR